MNRQLIPMREFKPKDGIPISQVSYSPTGSRFLGAMNSTETRLFFSDGQRIQSTIAGDMYIQDMQKTKGHVASTTCGAWNPKVIHGDDSPNFITGSLDGTIRIWDINSKAVGMD